MRNCACVLSYQKKDMRRFESIYFFNHTYYYFLISAWAFIYVTPFSPLYILPGSCD
jgi:hypothetical protein